MQIKTMSSQYKPIRMTQTWTIDNTKYWCGIVRTPMAGENIKWNSCFGRRFDGFLEKEHNSYPYSPAIVLISVCPEYLKTCVHTGSFIDNFQNLDATEVVVSRWVDKLVYLDSGILFTA